MTMKVHRDRGGKRQIEEAHQQALFVWIRLMARSDPRYNNIVAIPMGGMRSVSEAARLKAGGVRAGVSDILVAQPSGGYPGLWIELKKPRVKFEQAPVVSKDQGRWLDQMTAAGYLAVVAYGWEAAQKVILTYLGPARPPTG